MGYIHTTEYYSAAERNEVLICATTHMNLKNMLREGSQLQNATYCMI